MVVYDAENGALPAGYHLAQIYRLASASLIFIAPDWCQVSFDYDHTSTLYTLSKSTRYQTTTHPQTDASMRHINAWRSAMLVPDQL